MFGLLSFAIFGSIYLLSLSDLAVTNRENSSLEEGGTLPWWKTAVLYQIYPRSFKDSNSDGVGDLKGILSKIGYLNDIGIGAVWLSPVYTSPMADFGYDISNYVDIGPLFGTLQDFDDLIKELKANGIRTIMDFIPNHSSDEHEWFIKSVKKIDPYTDYYVWKDAKSFNESGHPIPPNNWVSVYGSAWEWSKEREQFYFHQYERKQPDLNVRNPLVLQELENIIKFWFDRGVDGLRIDALQRLFEVEDASLDEPVNEDITVDPNSRNYLKHIYTMNQPETFQVLRQWRKIAESYGDKMITVQVFDKDVNKVMPFYGSNEEPLAHFPLNFYLMKALPGRKEATGHNIKESIDEWMNNMPHGFWPNWVIGTHDDMRVGTRIGADLVDSINMLNLLLKGTPITYYGEEIGMEDTFVTFEEAQDLRGINFGPEKYHIHGRDPQRSPFQWEQTRNAGFSSANKTWLPVNENIAEVNVDTQMRSKQSHLKVYKDLVQLRKETTFLHGNLSYALITVDIFSFVRHLEGNDSFLVVINTSLNENAVDLSKDTLHPLPSEGKIIIRSSSDERPETSRGSIVALNKVTLLPGEGVVIRLQEA